MDRPIDPRGIVLPDDNEIYRSRTFQPRRSQWPGMLATAVIGGAIAALALSSFRDDRPARSPADGLRTASAQRAPSIAPADAGITAAVKAALAADPALGSLPIAVSTQDGVVTLSGPAPDESTRVRAAALAAAPEGVRGVDNRLLVLPTAARS